MPFKLIYQQDSMDCGSACLAMSTAAACFILNTCLIEGAKLALKEGVKPPVYLSGNVDGGREHNIVLENTYLGRVKHL